MSEERGMVRAQPGPSPQPIWGCGIDLVTLGRLLAKSGYFKDARDEAQAVTRILYGAELGIGPVSSMAGIDIIDGKPSLSANLMASVVRRSGRYDFRIIERTDKRCELSFVQRSGAGWVEMGRAVWTIEDAQRAELLKKDNWRKYPRAMLFARAMSEGATAHCPELFGGAPFYTPEEMGAETNPEIHPETGESLAAMAPALEAVPLPPPAERPHDLDYWRRRTMALYTELGGVPSERDACRADLAAILGIEAGSRTLLTAEQWRHCAEHMERQLREAPIPVAADDDPEDPFGNAEADTLPPPQGAPAPRETSGAGLAQQSGL